MKYNEKDKERVKRFLQSPDNKLTITQVAQMFGLSERTLATWKAKWKAEGHIFPEPLINQHDTSKLSLEDNLLVNRLRAQVKDKQDAYNGLMKEYGQLLEKYDHALMLKEAANIKPAIINIDPSVDSQAVPIIQWSDWHVEERVEKSTTRGLNEFNPDIAKKRVSKLAESTLKLVRKERQDVNINEIMICLGGDFINSYLHEHDKEMNFMSPIEACTFAKTLIVEALTNVALNGDFDRIIVMCIRGNHPRLTRRMQSSNDYKMNLEAMIYYMVRQELSDPIFEFHIPESEHGYVDVLGKKIRCYHGHQISYQGGVGDLTIPCNKAIMRWDKTEKADWNLMHHFHSYWMPTRNCSLNGSLVGYNSYALSCGFAYEPPLQTFHLLDAKRGFTVRTPIICQ